MDATAFPHSQPQPHPHPHPVYSPPLFDNTLPTSHDLPPNPILHHSVPFPTSSTSSPLAPQSAAPPQIPLLFSSLTQLPQQPQSSPLPLSFSSLSTPPPVPKRRRTTAPLLPQPSPSTSVPLSTPRVRRKTRSRTSNASQSSQKTSLNGLKTFTMSVVAKLKQYHSSSSYTAVADELVRDAFDRLRNDGQPFSAAEVDKNIRRRVYDALNVLASMGFVARSGKDVEWKGIAGFMRHVGLRIPNVEADATGRGTCECQSAGSSGGVSARQQGNVTDDNSGITVHTCNLGPVERCKLENERMRKRIAEKRARISELSSQEAYLEKIVTRNASRDSTGVTTGFDVLVSDDMEYVRPDPNRVDLPFVMISTKPGTDINVEMEDDKEQMVFRFDAPFKIHEGYSIVGQVCQQEERDREAKLALAKLREESEMMKKCGSWGDFCIGDAQFPSPVTEIASKSPCDVVRFEESIPPPLFGGAMKRRSPPCFALHRPDSGYIR